ncbi:MAG: hypothetical protein ACRD0U_11570 [Acidimicrobiales bacterium]
MRPEKAPRMLAARRLVSRAEREALAEARRLQREAARLLVEAARDREEADRLLTEVLGSVRESLERVKAVLGQQLEPEERITPGASLVALREAQATLELIAERARSLLPPPSSNATP